MAGVAKWLRQRLVAPLFGGSSPLARPSPPNEEAPGPIHNCSILDPAAWPLILSAGFPHTAVVTPYPAFWLPSAEPLSSDRPLALKSLSKPLTHCEGWLTRWFGPPPNRKRFGGA